MDWHKRWEKSEGCYSVYSIVRSPYTSCWRCEEGSGLGWKQLSLAMHIATKSILSTLFVINIMMFFRLISFFCALQKHWPCLAHRVWAEVKSKQKWNLENCKLSGKKKEWKWLWNVTSVGTVVIAQGSYTLSYNKYRSASSYILLFLFLLILFAHCLFVSSILTQTSAAEIV